MCPHQWRIFMPTSLTAGTRFSVELQDVNNNILYQTVCASREELKTFIAKHGKSTTGYSVLEGAIFPMRTDTPAHFSKDFFLPTWAHFASKINNVVLKYFVAFFAVALDLVTLPVRLLTTAYQLYYNNKHKEKHPALELIGQRPDAHKVLEEGVVNLCYTIDTVKTSAPTIDGGDSFQNAEQTLVEGTIRVALRRLPGLERASSEKTTGNAYSGRNGVWVLSGTGFTSSASSSFAC